MEPGCAVAAAGGHVDAVHLGSRNGAGKCVETMLARTDLAVETQIFTRRARRQEELTDICIRNARPSGDIEYRWTQPPAARSLRSVGATATASLSRHLLIVARMNKVAGKSQG